MVRGSVEWKEVEKRRNQCSKLAVRRPQGEGAQSTRAAVTKYGGLAGFSHGRLWSHSSGGWRSAGLVSSESSPWLAGWLPFCYAPLPCVCLCPKLFLWHRHIELGPIHMTSCYLNHLFKGLISKYSHILKSWGLGLQHMNFEGTHFIIEKKESELGL